MKPEAKPKADIKPSREPFLELGISAEWMEPLQALGYDSVYKIKAEEKSDRLHQKIMGYRKNNKLEISTVTIEKLTEWIS